MERYSILSESPAGLQAAVAQPEAVAPVATARDILRFPGEDGGQSLTDMAERDLEAALRLLAERAQYITEASGSAIGLLQGGEMICRASSGSSSLQVGMRLAEGSGLAIEAARCGQMLRCDDAQADSRVNAQSCRVLGVISAMAMPLRRGEDVVGAFELVSGKARAFEEHDVAAMQRLGEMVQTALEHADAAKRAAEEIDLKAQAGLAPAQMEPPDNGAAPASEEDLTTAVTEAVPPVERGDIRKCEACGFPVSGLRRLCLDCAAARGEAHLPAPIPTAAQFASAGALTAAPEAEEGWLQSHKYILGMLLAGLVAAVVLLWLR